MNGRRECARGWYLGSTDPVKVLVRINDGKPIETRWLPSTTGTAASTPGRALPDNGKLFIRAFGYNGNGGASIPSAGMMDVL